MRSAGSRRSLRPDAISSATRKKPCESPSRPIDRKSTRLNSSHANISYAVFCLTPLTPISTLFPYTTLFRSLFVEVAVALLALPQRLLRAPARQFGRGVRGKDAERG